ncbi:MAG TPA: D-aminoacyl-tRNA deacylase [Cyclobacteriaceae bacterium]|nr:D-aminoacyl-tRNA deacylase [Cyclobacteriaceae bacterium]
MIAVIQRVSESSVTIDGMLKSKIGKGLMVLLGIEDADNAEDIEWLTKKIVNLRVFDDAQGVMNESVLQQKGEILVVSQFTLHASVKKGNRPSYIKAARPEIAIPIYERFIETLEKELGRKVGSGIFGAMMQVALVNDGPVTIIVDTKNKV